MPSFISHLTETQQRELLYNLNYLNTAEIKSFCKKLPSPTPSCVKQKMAAKNPRPNQTAKASCSAESDIS